MDERFKDNSAVLIYNTDARMRVKCTNFSFPSISVIQSTPEI